ncbi:MAG: right-handed parallel beta-helix repeat-containing protein [Bacteroidetes bacterium]|nr:right-handed parallel beta-helix repeat-containing protein [Bacteroidota bacterium]
MKNTNSLLCLTFVLLLLVTNIRLFATTIHVPSQIQTIQEAIDISLNGDTILVASGTYSGVGNYDIDFSGKKIVLKSANGASNTIIDCMSIGRGFNFQSNEDSTAILDGFTIQNGFATDEYGNGGGIFCFWSSPLIKNCRIINNSSERGGGISFISSNAIIRDCIINFNNSNWAGGINLSSASVEIYNSEISYNTATYEGGISVTMNSTLTINDCSINNNTSQGEAIDIYYGSNVNMKNCYVQNNTAIGIYITNGSSLNMSNCLVSDNLSDGLRATNADQINIVNSSVVFNNNWGIFSMNSTFNIKNSILYGNLNEQIYLQSAPLPFIEYTNIENRLSGGIVGNINWGDGNMDVYPDFVDTLSKNYRLLPISLCNAAGTLIGAPSNDLDYNVRPLPTGTNPDIGAFEVDQSIISIFESSLESTLKIYPNPFSNHTTLQVNKTLKDATLSIYNSVGHLSKRITNINEQTITLQRDNLPVGLYFIELTDDNNMSISKKLIITN